MKISILLLAVLFLQTETPFKPMEEIEVKLNFEFRERIREDANKINMDQTRATNERSRGSGPLPYLFVNVKVLKQNADEVRLKVVENGSRIKLNKKFDMNTLLKLDLGFTDDIKDRVTAHEYTIYYLTKDKQPLSKIIIFFEEDGTYIVNGQVRGKL